MSASPTNASRIAPTDNPIIDVLAQRWSPLAFDPEATIDETVLSSALEAARWSPSAYNLQPWRFIVARRGTAEHDLLLPTLQGFNQVWAANASVLIVAIAETANEEGKENSHALYDLGQSVAHLSIQAHHSGVHVHQMSGFDPAAAAAAFGLDARFSPTTVIALGYRGENSTLPEDMRVRETRPRARRTLTETVLTA